MEGAGLNDITESLPSPNSLIPEWLVALVTNLGLYIVMVGVAYGVINLIRRSPPGDSDDSFYAKTVRFCVFGPRSVPDEDEANNNGKPHSPEKSDVDQPVWKKAVQLAFCTFGLLGSYLSWGVLQERIMSTEYDTGRFTSSNFLVFCNRLLALIASSTVLSMSKNERIRAPFYKFSFTSLSNVLSSWCQLEALKYVSFPTQVLAKSSKMIPVMLMGKVISKKSYPWYEYAVAVVIGAGVTLFMVAQKGDGGHTQNTQISGLFLLICYLTFDSFTSQWQDHLFTEYQLSSYQMMAGVNAFSATFTFVSLLQSGELFQSISFIGANPVAMWHIIGFSFAGCCGQMFIFYTIKSFGPLVFTMIMTTRQLVAIVLSVILFGHKIGFEGLLGASIVFAAIGYRIHRKEEERKEKKTRNKEIQLESRKQEAPVNGVEESVPLKEDVQDDGHVHTAVGAGSNPGKFQHHPKASPPQST